MKLRLHKDSIRIRFNVAEVAALGHGTALTEAVQFGPSAGQHLSYRVVPDPALTAGASARLDGSDLIVTASAAALAEWSAGAGLAFSHELQWEGGKLTILLEKDMQRLNPKPGANQGDVFPNPMFGKAKCDHP